MRVRTRALLVACLVSSSLCGHSQSTLSAPAGTTLQHKNAITPELSKYIDEALRSDTIPGLALGVFHADGESEFGTWGNKTEDGEAMSTDTLFIMASCSKAFLSASIGILMDDYAHGRNATLLPAGVTTFNWDTKVKDILPGEWGLMDEWADAKASFRDILSHRSGVPRHDFSYGPQDSAKDVVRRMKYLRPAFELREKWSYNNLFYMLGAHLISKYTGSYTQFVQDRIFDPLNMTSSTFSPGKAASSGKLTQTWTTFGRRIPVWFTEENAELSSGPGGIISNIKDLEHWVRTLMNHGVDPRTNRTIIPRSVFDVVTTAQAIVHGEGSAVTSISGYGMGWGRSSYYGHDIIEHSGGIPGISTLVTFLPAEGLGFVILTNADTKSFTYNDLPQRIVRDVFGHSEHKPEDLVPQRAPHTTSSPESSQLYPTRNRQDSHIPLDAYAGTYGNAGYGSLTLCAPSSTSAPCAKVLAEFDAIDAAGGWSARFNGSAQLFASWERLWSSHLRLVHLSGNKFAMFPTSLFPQGYGRDTTPFETSDALLRDLGGEPAVEFVVGANGKVVGGGLNGLVEQVGKKEGTVEETAEAWFEKA
ncbi:beta-lactamase/transpeptidase-like protein [Dentipellis sp. KUC8613]|nr:beta-lactamase/transpeptidase-like protein [Dentipellis sp. KUC8613]